MVRDRLDEPPTWGRPDRRSPEGLRPELGTRPPARLSPAESPESLRLLMERSPLAIFFLEGDRIVEVNPATERLFGLSRVAILGATPYDLSPEQQPDGRSSREASLHSIDSALRGRPQFYPWRHLHSDGRLLETEVSLAAVRSSGRVYSMAMVRDLTERLQLEDQLRQAQKMEVVGQLYGGIAHDLSNLLTAIRGYVDLAGRREPASPWLQETLQKIRQCTDRAKGLLRRVLVFSRRDHHAPQPVALNPLVEETALLLKSMFRADVEFEVRTDPDLLPVLADASQIEQTLMNLMLNARDAMPRGGRLTIRTSNEMLGARFAREHPSAPRGRYVCLEVSDTGTGIPFDAQPRIFEPFFSTKPRNQGTGLGLSIVHGVIKQHRGHVDFESIPGQGTTFWVYLPTAGYPSVDEDAPRVRPPRAGAEPAREGTSILLVEADQAVRDFTCAVLSEQGYHVLEAGSAEEAERAFLDAGGKVDVLVTEIALPGRQGQELAAGLRGQKPDLHVLYTTGYDPRAPSARSDLDGKADVLRKPYTLPELLLAVDRVSCDTR